VNASIECGDLNRHVVAGSIISVITVVKVITVVITIIRVGRWRRSEWTVDVRVGNVTFVQ
jgi:hypothetical protein